MMDFTTNQWAVVALVFVAGWLLGLMSRSGDGRWRRDYERERDAHSALRREHDALIVKRPTVAAVDNGHVGTPVDRHF